jgi:hypothetical protein
VRTWPSRGDIRGIYERIPHGVPHRPGKLSGGSFFETVEQARAFLERRGRESLRGLKCVAIVLLFAGCIALVMVASPAARAQPSVSNEVQKLLASDGAGFDLFGRSVAISGDAVVIGAYLDDDNGIDSGSAYPFSVAIATQVPIPEAVAAALAALLGLTGSHAARIRTHRASERLRTNVRA